jgi:hypothetical protein
VFKKEENIFEMYFIWWFYQVNDIIYISKHDFSASNRRKNQVS